MRAKQILFSACAALAIGLSLSSAPALAASEMEELAQGLHPGDFSPRVEQLLTNGHAAQALELADIGIRKNPRNAQLQFLRTVSLEALGRTEDAEKGLKSLIAAYPEIPEPYNNLAVIEAGFGNLEEALGLLKKALVINPKFSLAQKNLGDVYLALALECYENAAPALEKNAELQSRLRTLRRITGR